MAADRIGRINSKTGEMVEDQLPASTNIRNLCKKFRLRELGSGCKAIRHAMPASSHIRLVLVLEV
jgi:hypothetical protein